MLRKKGSKKSLVGAVFGVFFLIIGVLSGVSGVMLNTEQAFAVPEGSNTTTTNEGNSGQETNSNSTSSGTNGKSNADGEAKKEKKVNGCKSSLEEIGWWVCPVTEKIADATDWLYDKIEEILIINPVEMKDGTPIYEIWKYCRGITNVVFIIFFLVVIYSQITGVGISNYGIKKALPKLIVVAILVNLSFLICSLLVDVSNIVGNSLRGVFTSVQETALTANGAVSEVQVSLGEVLTALVGGTTLAVGLAIISFEFGTIWMLIPVVLGAIVAVASGLITIALRQAVVALLIMISPLAVVAYMLPNTEGLFKKWKALLTRMLVFYPMFAVLFGASQLAGAAIIASANSGFGVILGLAVQIFPLFFSWKLMKMSGTFLGEVNSRLRGLAARPLAANRAWADSHRQNRRANTLARGVTPSARLMQYLNKRRALREEDTKNATAIAAGKASLYTQRKIANSKAGDMTSKSKRTSRYTRNAKMARNYTLLAENAVAHTSHAMDNYGDYFDNGVKDKMLVKQAENAWIDHGRALYQKEFDDENDQSFLVERYLQANKRDANNRPVDEVAFNRYVKSVISGPRGEERLLGKIIKQAATVESKQRSEIAVSEAKFGHNGDNKKAFRSFVTGYMINDDGWAIDRNGKRLKNEDGSFVETVQGDALTKAPEKLVLYDKRDEHGIYFDMKDQDGNIVSRIYRGTGADGKNHDDAAYIKEMLANWDIPISDPINNVYGILSGIKPGDVVTPQGQNDIGLARYSTTIGRAMSNYKGDASWAGAMFNTGLGNRQITNAAQYAIWVLDSIKKTLRPGAFNTQNPASVKYIRSILDPSNWDKIFTEEEIRNAVNINNELFGGEEWLRNEDGSVMRDESGEIMYETVENPTYEQMMNTLKRKLIFPAMAKVLPAFDRLRTSNTADNQKPGTADEQYEFLKMVQEKWENNLAIDFDPTLVNQDLQSEARAFRQRKHDKDGNLIYPADGGGRHLRPLGNLLNMLEEVYDGSMLAEDLKRNIFSLLESRVEYSRALQRFDELCSENPDATMHEIYGWFTELDTLVRYEN